MTTDRDRVLARLRRGPVHSTEIRRSGLSGNPSQRIAELRDLGHHITAESKPWKDANGKRRPGTLYTLTLDPERGSDTQSGAPARVPSPPSPVAAPLEAEPVSLFPAEEPVETTRYMDVWEAA